MNTHVCGFAACRLSQRSSHEFIRVRSTPRRSAACSFSWKLSHAIIRIGSTPAIALRHVARARGHRMFSSVLAHLRVALRHAACRTCVISMCHIHVALRHAACRTCRHPPCTRTHAHTHGIILSDAFLACRLDFNNQRSAPPNGWRQLLTPSRRLRMRRDAETHMRSHRSRCQEPPGDTEPRASLNHSHRCPDCLGTAKLSLAGSSPWERNAQLQSATDIGQAPQSCTHLTTKSRWNTRASASLIRSLA